jgi:hypothetical protein
MRRGGDLKMRHLAAFVLLGGLLLAVAARAQECGDCPGPKPTCPQYQEPTCNGGTWVCPEPICSEFERRTCEEDYCGIFDETTCTCYTDPGGCYPCDDDERRRCIDRYCPDDGYCWDDELCICWAEDFRGQAGQVGQASMTHQSKPVFLGHFPPPATTSCEEAKIPTSLIWDVGELRNHNGDAIVISDPTGRTPPRQLAEMAWGISRPLQYWVMDQNDDALRSGDMEAIERLELQDANPWPNDFVSSVRVPVGDDGVFFDCLAFYGRSIIFRPQIGHFLQSKQRIYIRKGRDEYHVRTNCIRMEHDAINVRECN